MHHVLVVEVGAGHVDQLTGLLLDGSDDMGMAVAGGGHGDAGGEIEELIAVDVGDDDAASALGHQRIRTGVGRRNIFLIAGEDALGVGAGQRGLELGTEGLCFASGGRGHGLGGHEVLRNSRGVVRGWSLVSHTEDGCAM